MAAQSAMRPQDRPRHLGVVVEPLASLRPKKDSTIAILRAAAARGWQLWAMECRDLAWTVAGIRAHMTALQLVDNKASDGGAWYLAQPPTWRSLTELDVLLMRADPPVDARYLHATQMLSEAERHGLLVLNRPQSLRDGNEKLLALEFPGSCPPTLSSASSQVLAAFRAEVGAVVLKPLDGMGGHGILVMQPDDLNFKSAVELLSHGGRLPIIAQRFLPEVRTTGDRRILLVDDQLPSHALVRMPPADDIRGNLVAGGQAELQPLSDAERSLCQRVATALSTRGIAFAGLDVIGEQLTEVNITSPTGLCELRQLGGPDLAAALLDAVERRWAVR